MALPTNADVIVVHGYWLDELTGVGVKQANGLPATIMFDPVPLLGANAAKTPNLRDLTSNAHLKTRTRVASVDPVTGYYAAQLVASNDPDLDAYSGRKVTFLGEDPFTIEVPYNAPTVTVSAEMAAKTGLTQGSSVKAIWLPNASVTTIPTPTPPNNYLTSSQTLATIAAGIETHDEDPAAHADIRAVLATIPEQARDAVGAALVAGSGITVTVDDTANTITLTATGGGGSSYTDEQAQDAFAALVAAGTHSGISFAYNDAGNAISATVAAPAWASITGKPTTWVTTMTGAAIQSAITSLGTAGGVVNLVAGTYTLTSPITMASKVTLQGQGQFTTILQQTTAGTDAIAGSDLSHVSIRDLHVTGPDATRAGTAGSGINFTLSGTGGNATFYVDLDNVYVDNFGLDGIALSSPIVTKLRRCVAFKNNRHGFYLYGDSTAQSDGTSTHFDACFAGGNYGAGYRLFQMAYTSLNGCAADSNGCAYEYATCVGITENGCGSEEPYNFTAHQSGYTGLSRRVINTKMTMNSPYMIGNINIAALITSGSQVTINNLFEGSPGNTDEPTNNPTNSLKVDSGCTVVAHLPSVVTPMSLATGTTTVINSLAAVAASGSASDITTGTLPDGVIPAGIARDSEVATAVANLVNSAPGTLDTLGEIATQLAADESTAAALATTVGQKAAKSANLSDLASASTARTNLGLATVAATGSYTDLTAKPTIPSTPGDIGAQPADADLTTIAALDATTAGTVASDGSGWIKKTYAQLKTALSLVKADVGLGSVDNTADTGKPVSTAQQAALDTKAPLLETVNTVATSGTTQTLPDVTTATIHDITLTANCTLTFPTLAAGKSFTLVLRQDATGSRTVTWPSGIKWPSGTVPTLSTAASSTDTLTFMSITGSSWQGFLAGKGMA